MNEQSEEMGKSGSACGPSAELDGAIEAADRAPRWHRPAITRMDIRRTMLILGSVIDGVSGSI